MFGLLKRKEKLIPSRIDLKHLLPTQERAILEALKRGMNESLMKNMKIYVDMDIHKIVRSCNLAQSEKIKIIWRELYERCEDDVGVTETLFLLNKAGYESYLYFYFGNRYWDCIYYPSEESSEKWIDNEVEKSANFLAFVNNLEIWARIVSKEFGCSELVKTPNGEQNYRSDIGENEPLSAHDNRINTQPGAKELFQKAVDVVNQGSEVQAIKALEILEKTGEFNSHVASMIAARIEQSAKLKAKFGVQIEKLLEKNTIPPKVLGSMKTGGYNELVEVQKIYAECLEILNIIIDNADGNNTIYRNSLNKAKAFRVTIQKNQNTRKGVEFWQKVKDKYIKPLLQEYEDLKLKDMALSFKKMK